MSQKRIGGSLSYAPYLEYGRRYGAGPRGLSRFGATMAQAARAMRRFVGALKRARLWPEFAALDAMRWDFPTWRVLYRPFDWRIDA